MRANVKGALVKAESVGGVGGDSEASSLLLNSACGPIRYINVEAGARHRFLPLPR